ncbi:MAG: GAF domain-containing protein, partial [Spirulinaceae cyanobacterium]
MADLPTLDLAAVLQASQALSSFLELDELLVKIPQILVQHSGSDRCLLALPDAQDDWLIRAIATPDHPQLCSETLSQSHHCPVELLQSVSRTQQTVVIDGSKIEPATTIWHDPAPRPQSGFCHPLRHQDELLGILYLEHRTTPGVFTGDRQSVIRLLCNQAAISLHNSRRYNQKE